MQRATPLLPLPSSGEGWGEGNEALYLSNSSTEMRECDSPLSGEGQSEGNKCSLKTATILSNTPSVFSKTWRRRTWPVTVIPKTDHSEAMLFKPCRAFAVIDLLDRMLATVHLDYQTALMAEEVSHIWPSR